MGLIINDNRKVRRVVTFISLPKGAFFEDCGSICIKLTDVNSIEMSNNSYDFNFNCFNDVNPYKAVSVLNVTMDVDYDVCN